MPLELVSDENTIIVTETLIPINVIVDQEVVGIVTLDADVVVTGPSESVLFTVETPGPPGDPGIVAQSLPPSSPYVGMLWVELP